HRHRRAVVVGRGELGGRLGRAAQGEQREREGRGQASAAAGHEDLPGRLYAAGSRGPPAEALAHDRGPRLESGPGARLGGRPVAKKKTGRSSAVTKAAASGRRSTGGRKAVAAGPRPSGHELVPVVCSECFEELCFDTGVKTDSLTCPICE